MTRPQILWPLGVLAVGLFGFGVFFLGTQALSRRVAFRVDAGGVTLGGVPPRFRRSTAFVPWSDVTGLTLWDYGDGRFPAHYVTVRRRPGAPELPSGRGYGRFTRRRMGDDIAASRVIIAWSLDVPALRAALARLAPGIPLTDTRALNPPLSSGGWLGR
jgi:hypothetical protein